MNASKSTPAPSRKRPGQSRLANRVSAVLVVTALSITVVAMLAHFAAERQWRGEEARRRLLGLAGMGAARLSDLRREDLAATAPGGAQPWQVEHDDSDRVAFEAWSGAAARESGVVATALVDAEGVVLASWPPSVEVTALVSAPRGRAAGYVQDLSGNFIGAPSLDLAVAVAPIGRGAERVPLVYVCVVAELKPIAAGMSSRLGRFVGVVGGMAALIVAAALLLLQRQIFRPLAQLSNQLVSSRRRSAQNVPLERTDELGAIARSIHQMGEELESAHQRAHRLEDTVDSVVQRETREISRLLHHAKRDAEVDPLTQLANRRFIEERLEDLVAEQRGRNVNLVIVMLDVDNFKTLNDTEGHAVGDSVLRFIGELLRASLRDSDVAIRYGGDEFSVIFVDLSGHEAHAIAERVIRLFARQMPAMGVRTPVTLSAGVASMEDVGARTGSELMAKADEALYRSKRGGKNDVVRANA